MSRNPDRKVNGNKRIARAGNNKPKRRTTAGDREVGYGKPPVASRFVKRQSGNPRGRPRKPKPRRPRLSDALLDKYLEEEAYRPIALRENGERILLPNVQAVIRSLSTQAIKGNRLSQKYFLEWVARMEELYLQFKIDKYVRLERLKQEGENALAEHRRQGLPPPDLLPHPEDIVLRPSACEAYVNGPETEEDVHLYEHGVRLRDHSLLRSTHAFKLRKKSTSEPKNNHICMYLLMAQLLDKAMPPRYRWKKDADFFLMMEYSSLTKRERERRIDSEFTQLMATKPKYSLITPEMEWEIDRLVDRIKRSQDARQSGAAAS